MTKNDRQNVIKKLINDEEIGTQEDLTSRLNEMGLDVSQATVSRDINELNLTKIRGIKIKSKYALPSIKKDEISPKIIELFKQILVSIDLAGNLLVIKTMAGNGASAGMAIDQMHIPEILGTIAGDDTLLIVAKNEDQAKIIEKTLKTI